MNRLTLLTFVLWPWLVTGCGPAEPVSLTPVEIAFGSSGSFFYNETQSMVSRGQILTLSLQIPVDLHFSSQGQWETIRVERTGKVEFGQRFSEFRQGALRPVEFAGADRCVAVCNGHLYDSDAFVETLDGSIIELPESSDCSVVGFLMKGSYPERYEIKQINTLQLNRIAFQPEQSFTQDLRVGTETSLSSYLKSYLTLDGLLTNVPLGQGSIDRTKGLVLLKPNRKDVGLGIWVEMNEQFLNYDPRRLTVAVHLDPLRDSVQVNYPSEVNYSRPPGRFQSARPWSASLSFSDDKIAGSLVGRVQSLTSTDDSMWVFRVPLKEFTPLPVRPFMSSSLLQHVRADFALIRSTDGSDKIPEIGDVVPSHVWSINDVGFFRDRSCDGDLTAYGYWKALDLCALENAYVPVVVDECGALVPETTVPSFEFGRLSGDTYELETGTILPVARHPDGHLEVGRGARLFYLIPPFESVGETPAWARGSRARVEISEQVFDYRDDVIGRALNEPQIISSTIWQTVAPFRAADDGTFFLETELLRGTVMISSNEQTADGLPLKREFPLCDGYSESLFLRIGEASLLLEQRLVKDESQTLVRRVYAFN